MRKATLKKVFLLCGLIMTIVAACFILYSLGHPEMSWGNISASKLRILYLIYVLVNITFYILSFVYRRNEQIL
jgi:hypothetical protein